MKILDLRQFRSQDLEPLLEEERTLWDQCLQWDYSPTTDMIKRFVDARALAGYAAVEQDRPVGYGFYVYEGLKGLIGDAFVSKEHRNGGTEADLLTHMIETLQATPGIRRIEAQLMSFEDLPARHCFRAQNFQSYARKFLFLPLDGRLAAGFSTPSGVEFEPWNGRWFPEAASLITRAYQAHIDSAISDQYRSRAGATRFLENLICYPGCGVFNAECSTVAFEKGARRLLGMLLTSIVRDGVAHITQLCVDPTVQGTGMGSQLLAHVLHQLCKSGFQSVTLTVTTSNTRAMRLYEKWGFVTLRDFNAYAWDAAGWKPPSGLRNA